MDAPTHLKHKPLVSISDYDLNDGIYANETDAMALSIGRAQYGSDKEDLSAKVWRKPKGKWSRMSEELPVHRVLDLTILYLSALSGERPEELKTIGKYVMHENDMGEDIVRRITSSEEYHDVISSRINTLKSLIDKYF